MLSIEHYLILSLVLFVIGVAGLLLRRNVLVMLMSIELMLNAVNINLVAFSRLHGSADGQVFAVFIVVVVAAEAVVAVAIALPFLRDRDIVNADELDLLKW
jgi:NADH-quinone oxidoreductase subunit K